jgi:hypothetical protein
MSISDASIMLASCQLLLPGGAPSCCCEFEMVTTRAPNSVVVGHCQLDFAVSCDQWLQLLGRRALLRTTRLATSSLGGLGRCAGSTLPAVTAAGPCTGSEARPGALSALVGVTLASVAFVSTSAVCAAPVDAAAVGVDAAPAAPAAPPALKLDPDVQLLERMFALPTCVGGWCGRTLEDGSTQVVLRTHATDLRMKGGRSFLHTVRWSPSGGGTWLPGSAFPVELRDVLALTPSPSGKAQALIRSVTAGGNTQYFIEVGACLVGWWGGGVVGWWVVGVVLVQGVVLFFGRRVGWCPRSCRRAAAAADGPTFYCLTSHRSTATGPWRRPFPWTICTAVSFPSQPSGPWRACRSLWLPLSEPATAAPHAPPAP